MFMVVSIPWPVASANVQFQGLAKADGFTRITERRPAKAQPALVGSSR
jgi:hypothetical protein